MSELVSNEMDSRLCMVEAWKEKQEDHGGHCADDSSLAAFVDP